MLSKPCLRCGKRAVFTLLTSEPDPKRKGGQERSEPNVPLVWECQECSFVFPLIITAEGAK